MCGCAGASRPGAHQMRQEHVLLHDVSGNFLHVLGRDAIDAHRTAHDAILAETETVSAFTYAYTLTHLLTTHTHTHRDQLRTLP